MSVPARRPRHFQRRIEDARRSPSASPTLGPAGSTACSPGLPMRDTLLISRVGLRLNHGGDRGDSADPPRRGDADFLLVVRLIVVPVSTANPVAGMPSWLVQISSRTAQA